MSSDHSAVDEQALAKFFARPRLDIREFHERGYLQEVNRLFFHRLGLALAVVIDSDGTAHLSEILDGRDDPEGWVFTELDADDAIKSAEIARQMAANDAVRREHFGWAIQPAPSVVEG